MMPDDPADDSTEAAQRLMWSMDMVEPEAAKRIADRETERIEYRAECVAEPDKWRTTSG